MDHMLCRNRVRDFAVWKSAFDSHAARHRAAGLKLVHLWRTIDDGNNVFFLFEVSSLENARAFIRAPAAAEAGKESGVVDGEYHFLREGERY